MVEKFCALIALGANLESPFGKPKDSIIRASEIISEKLGAPANLSSLWYGAPVPASDQPWYTNSVLCIDTRKRPLEILDILHEIELAFGRKRTQNINEARPLDLDLLDCGGVVMNDERLTLPHPRMNKRDFVLMPLIKISPNWRHPITGTHIHDLIAQLPPSQLREIN